MIALLVACTGPEKEPQDTGDTETTPPPTTDTEETDDPTPVDTAGPTTPTGDTGGTTTEPVRAFVALVYRPASFGQLEPSVAEFGVDGCVLGEHGVTLSEQVHQLVATADGRWFAIQSHTFGEVNPKTGAWSEIPVPFYTSHFQSVGIDPLTGEVLIGTLGGAGELIAYDPVAAAFDLRGSFDNDDIVALLARADGTLLAAQMPYYDEVDEIGVYDLDDASRAGTLRLSAPQLSPDGSDYFSSQSWQLREHAGTVFMLVRTGDPLAPSRTVTVDVVTGDVADVVCP